MATFERDRQIYAALHISRPDGVTWVDVTPYLVRAEVELGDVADIGTGTSGVDGVVRRLVFTLQPERSNIPTWSISAGREATEVIANAEDVVAQATDPGHVWWDYLLEETHTYAGASFAPGDRKSPWNIFNGQYEPLLKSMREVILRVAAVPRGTLPQPGDWVTLFHGYLGDSIRTQGSAVTCECRDFAKLLQQTYIEQVRTYGSEQGTPAEVVIQQILDDNLGPGVVQLYCPVSPGFMITPYQLEYKTVWDAIQEIAAQIGWYLGYRRDQATDQFKLTFMEPPRSKGIDTADFVLDLDHDIYVHDLAVSDADIRNVIYVTYRDKASGERRTVVVENADSIAQYGRRAMRIEEADTSLIDTEAEARALGEAAAADLGDLTGTRSIEMPLLPQVDVFSGIVTRDWRISDQPEFTAVESVRHVLDFSGRRFRTEVVGTSRVIGGHARWLRMEARPGSPGLPVAPEQIGGGGVPLPAPADVQVRTIPGGIEVYVPEPPVHSARWAATEVYVSDQQGFVPGDTTRRAMGRATTFQVPWPEGGATVYVRAAYVDAEQRRWSYSAEAKGTTGRIEETPDTTPPATPTGLSYDFGGPDLYVRWSPVERAVAYRVRISDATRVRREVHVAGSSYTYAYADNVYDGSGTPAAALTVEVWARTREGVYSVQPAQVQAVNTAPEKPAVVVESSMTQLRWRITSPLPLDLREVRVTAGSYEETSTATYGTVSLREAGIADGASAQVTVVLVDAFGQESEPQTATVTGRYLSVEDMAGAIFQIQAEAYNGADESWAPDVGELPMLWDGNTESYVFWHDENMDKGPLRIVFRYPTTWFFDMVRFHSVPHYTYTVEAEIDGQWTKVAEGVSEWGWTIKRFDRMVLTRALRLTLIDNIAYNFGYHITELKFWTVTMADEILAQKLRLTGDMAIVNNDGTVQFTSQGIEIGSVDQGSTLLSPGGLVFNRPDGSRSGYVRAIVPGVAQDGEYVPLNFINDPVVILSPARATVHNPAVNGIQKLRLEATEVSPDGFRVVAKLLRHNGPGQRTVFPNTERYRWSTWYSSSWCTDGGHVELADEPRAWSEHRLRDVGDRKVFTTASGTTGVVIRIREMLHVHAWAGNYYARNSISYRLRIRPVGSGSWTRTVGPITRSIETVSSLITTRLSYRHPQVTYVISDLAPDEYELEIEVTGKSLSLNGSNGADAMYLLIEEIEEMQEEEIPTPEPIIVHYVAFESDSPRHDIED